MGHKRLTRRQFSTAAALGSVAVLAGCADDEDDDTEDVDGTGDDVGDDLDDEEADDADAADDGDADDGGDDTEDVDDFDEEDLEDDPVGDLTIILENEDGEPVSSGVEVTIDPENDEMTHGFGEADIEDGETIVSLDEQDDYTITVESTEDAFEPVEEAVTISEDDEEVTITLEGAAGDEPEEEENGEEEEADDEEADDEADDEDVDDEDADNEEADGEEADDE